MRDSRRGVSCDRQVGFSSSTTKRSPKFMARDWAPPCVLVALSLLLLLSRASVAQVAPDTANTSSASAELTRGATTDFLTFNHTTAAANMVLVVSVSMNISTRAATVSGVTYNGV